MDHISTETPVFGIACAGLAMLAGLSASLTAIITALATSVTVHIMACIMLCSDATLLSFGLFY